MVMGYVLIDIIKHVLTTGKKKGDPTIEGKKVVLV
jgi:hypothetical protein